MAKEEGIKRTGVVTKIFGAMYEVIDDKTNFKVMVTICGKMKKNSIQLSLGDKVEFEVSPYDLTKGRVTYRFKR